MEEKFKSLEEKESEMRQLKTLLRERDRDIERANQMLLTAEEGIDVSVYTGFKSLILNFI